MRDALAPRAAPVVAVSPIVGGAVLKGPTADFMDWAGRTLDAAGIAAEYGARRDGGLLDAILADEAPAGGAAVGVDVSVAPTLMASAEQRRDVAAAALASRARRCAR